jgi:hypothetical protein
VGPADPAERAAVQKIWSGRGTVERGTEYLVGFSARATDADLGVGDIWAALGRVHQGELTVQSMVFEPAARAIHVAFGLGPTTDRTPVRIELMDLLGGERPDLTGTQAAT